MLFWIMCEDHVLIIKFKIINKKARLSIDKWVQNTNLPIFSAHNSWTAETKTYKILVGCKRRASILITLQFLFLPLFPFLIFQ